MGDGYNDKPNWSGYKTHNTIKNLRSELGVEALTAMILQYAMCAKEARSVLLSTPLSNPGLMPLYNNYKRMYYEGPGVEVSGAGDSRVNGWYSRTEAEALLNLSTSEVFDRVKMYEKEDGCYIDQLRVSLPDTLATSRCH